MSQKFTVIWQRRVLEIDIAGFALSAMQRGEDVSAINLAMNRIEQLLSTEPETRGESRGDFERVLIAPPLSIDFEIHEEEQIVFILGARYRPIKFGKKE